MTAPTNPDPIPRCLEERYRLVERLGRGGMGSVWRAYDERLNRPVAVKILDTAGADAEQARAEARALAQLSHPNIASVFDFGDSPGRPFLVMELVQGRPLATVLGEGQLSWEAAVAVVSQVASALAAAHERGVVHRDVTPANIMVTATEAKLIDFGISAVKGQAEVDSDGGLHGTPAYVAPERLHGDTVAPPSDVYSLGLVLYRALSGRLPWRGINAREFWAQREHSDPAPLPAIAGLPADVADICVQCLARDPEGRPDTATLSRVLASAAPPEAYRQVCQLVGAHDGPLRPTQLIASWSTKRSSAGGRSRIARLAVAGALVAAGLGCAWPALGWSPFHGDALPQAINAPEPQAKPRTGCDVTFNLAADDGQRFDATIVATPRSAALPDGWRLSMKVPGPGMDSDPAAGWMRDADRLTSPIQQAVEVGQSVQLTLSGRHTGAVAMPTTMNIDGAECATVLLASAPATPATVAVPPAAGTTGQPPGQRDKAAAGRPSHRAGSGNPGGNEDGAGGAQ
jgi:serine/threonine-protein kinase